MQYFVRLGVMGTIERAHATTELDRGRRVLVRTPRGIEMAEIVADVRSEHAENAALQIVRPTSAQDEWMLRRLRKPRRDALRACRERLSDEGSNSVLLDAEQIFDGGTLVMHFLGEPDAVARRIGDEIVAEYERAAGTREFARLLSQGCGPGCGTQSGGCATCQGCGSSQSCGHG